ncbi:MAG: hypothetical protein R2855_13600 [Thermomicrobiales bacterium]
MRDLDHLLEGERRVRCTVIDETGHRGGTVGDRLLQFGGIGALPGSDERQPPAPNAVHTVVHDAGAVEDDFVREAIAVRQGSDAFGIAPGHAGRRGQHHTGCRSAGDHQLPRR